MFKIIEIKITTERYPFIKPFQLSGGVINDFLQLFCTATIECDGKKFRGSGHAGISPIWSDKRKGVSFSEKEAQSVALARCAAGIILGKEFLEPLAAFEHIKKAAKEFSLENGLPKLSQYVAMSPLDMAIWDAFARSKNKNIYHCLPNEIKTLKIFGKPRDIWVAHTIGIGEDSRNELAFAKKHGLKWFKIKLKGDLGRDKNVLEVFFADFFSLMPKVILDGNEGYSAADLKKLVVWLGTQKFVKSISYIEQPIARDSKASLLGIKSAFPIFADEMVCDAGDLKKAIKLGYQGVALKPTAKTFSETIKMMPLIVQLGLKTSVTDLTNCAPLAYPFQCEFAARLRRSAAGVEINSYKFVDIKFQNARLPAGKKNIFKIKGGKIKTRNLKWN